MRRQREGEKGSGGCRQSGRASARPTAAWPGQVKFAESAAVPASMRGLRKALRRRFMVVDEEFAPAAAAEGEEVLAQHPEFTRSAFIASGCLCCFFSFIVCF